VSAAAAVLYHDDLRVIPWAVELCREAMRAVRRNLYRALVYNIIGMTLAACGVLHPVAAAVLMVVSSLSLIVSSSRVGVRRRHCVVDEAQPSLNGSAQSSRLPLPVRQALAHGGAFALQGALALALLVGLREFPAGVLVLGGFALGGLAVGTLWLRWTTMPHTVEMGLGMLTLGNLGMLLGWWADNGCAPLHDGGCCGCVQALREGLLKPWMWLGMLIGANAAMVWLVRPALRRRSHTFAMYTGGNLGMVIGMAAGAAAATWIELDSVVGAASLSFLGMTVGMLAGMLLGTAVVEAVILRLQHWCGRSNSRVAVQSQHSEPVEPSRAGLF
jgi:hypothetical protein